MSEITVEAVKENLSKIIAFVDEELGNIDCPPKANAQINICIDEIFGNIVRYAYGSGTGYSTVLLHIEEAKRLITLTFIDEGMPFDPLSVAEPDITLPLEERPIGGLGLLMVRSMVDSMEYRREDGRNVLTLRKHI